MKTQLFILFGLIAFAFTACDMNGSTNTSPEILYVINPVANKTDSLNKYYTDVANEYRLDTIHVGDTVTFRMLFYGFTNNLTTCNIVQSDTTATKIIFPSVTSLDSIFLSSASNYSQGKFTFKNKISSLYFPFKYVARKPSTNAKITFYLSSDANFTSTNSLGANSVTTSLVTPIEMP